MVSVNSFSRFLHPEPTVENFRVDPISFDSEQSGHGFQEKISRPTTVGTFHSWMKWFRESYSTVLIECKPTRRTVDTRTSVFRHMIEAVSRRIYPISWRTRGYPWPVANAFDQARGSLNSWGMQHLRVALKECEERESRDIEEAAYPRWKLQTLNL